MHYVNIFSGAKQNRFQTSYHTKQCTGSFQDSGEDRIGQGQTGEALSGKTHKDWTPLGRGRDNGPWQTRMLSESSVRVHVVITYNSYLLPLVTHTLSVFDEICKRPIWFIISYVVQGSALVSSVVRYGLTVARYNSVIGSNALFCCDQYSCSLLRSNINLLNLTSANSRHNLISDKMKQAALFLYEMLCIREGVFEFCHSQIFCQDHKLMTLFLFYHVNDCML